LNLTYTPAMCPLGTPCEVPLGANAQRMGCPFRVSGITARDTAVHMKINRTDVGLKFKMKFDWDHGYPSGAPIVLFGYRYVPRYLRGVSFYWEDYYWASATSGSQAWGFSTIGRDAYHADASYAGENGNYRAGYAYCGDGDPIPPIRPCRGAHARTKEHTGFYYVTFSGAFIGSGENVGGLIDLEFAFPPATISQPQLDVIKNLWQTTCWPTLQLLPVFNMSASATQPNKHWTRANHIAGVYSSTNPSPTYNFLSAYSTNGAESDSDNVPFCDWFFEDSAQATYTKVMGFTTSSCVDMNPSVSCDFDGNVEELALSSKGLQGSLPDISAFSKLKSLALSFNKLTGTLPPTIFSSYYLESVYLTKNNFTGPISCPTHSDPALTSFYVARNSFTGDLPECLFSSFPRLQNMDISYLRLNNARIPPSIKNVGGTFVNFFAEHSGLSGALPDELACIKSAGYFHFGRNAITHLPQYALDRMTGLYSLDMSYNMLSGEMPHFDNTTELRRLYLEHNLFSGDFGTQLTKFAEMQESGALSAAHLNANDFSGGIPTVFYNLVMNAHRLTTVEAAGNKFHCDGDTGMFPLWARRMGVTARFGKCTKVPKVFSMHPVENIVPGGRVTITGADFAPGTELKVKMGTFQFPASWVSATSIVAFLPNGLTRGQTFEVTVANYAQDFYSATTHPQTYNRFEVMVQLVSPPSPPPTPPPAPKSPPPPSPLPPPPPLGPGQGGGDASGKVYQVSGKFTVQADIATFVGDTADQSAIDSLKSVIATNAGVTAQAVTLTFTSGSVQVTYQIQLNDEQAASSAVASLNDPTTGIMTSPTLLANAINTQFATDSVSITIQVTEINDAPQSQALSSGSSSSDSAAVGVIIACVVVVILVVVLAVALTQRSIKKKKASTTTVKAVPVAATSTSATSVSATSASSSDVEMEAKDKI